MANEDPMLRFIFSLIFPSPPVAGRKHNLVERLKELRDTEKDFMMNDQYAEFRSTFVDELATRPMMSFSIRIVFITFGVAALVGMVCSQYYHLPIIGMPSVLVLLAVAWIWFGMERDYIRKRKLSTTDRLAAVDELLTEGLITADEASELKVRIQKL